MDPTAQQPAPQPIAQPVAQPTAQPLMQAEASLMSGVTVFGQQSGILTLDNQNLTFTDKTTGQVIFQYPVSSITYASNAQTMLKLRTNDGRTYRFNFGQLAFAGAAAAGGLIGLAMMRSIEKNNGLDQWVATMKQINPSMETKNISSLSWKLGLFIGLGLVVLIFLIAIIVAVAS
jgi:hypothetical protein